ncbi:major cardiolipin synthase ClsA [Verrucomicrobiota bacterium]|nr:cardiolipin synthase [Verrucomicrobiota bacterium]GDY16832.1 major cardiolipin synthase ClsA [Verrucomicrobiota bacterium]
MPAFPGYGRLVLRAACALGATAAVLLGQAGGWLTGSAALAIDWTCGLYVIFRIGSARVSPLYMLLWVPLAGLLPKCTALALFLFGGRKHSALSAAKREVLQLAWSLSEGPVTTGNAVRLLGDRHGRDTLESLRAEILAARRRIHIATYILAPDEVGRELVSLLARRAREGVEVRLLVDAVGSWGTPLILCRPLLRAGGHVARFNPALPLQGKGSANWRNHRKIAVFDGRVAIIGGQNLGLAYMGERPSNRRFRDCSFRLEGPVAGALEQVFIADWCQATDEPARRFVNLLRERHPAVGPAAIEVIAAGPDAVGDPLWEAYTRLFESARTSLTIVTPYFVPDRRLYQLLGAAARQGRKVQLILPRRSDHRLLDFARRWYLRTLHEDGADILFFKPDVLHAKLVVIDGEAAVIGSANLDMRSLFLNYEITAIVREPATVRAIEGYISALTPDCTRYAEDLYRASRTWQGRLGERLSRILAPLL